MKSQVHGRADGQARHIPALVSRAGAVKVLGHENKTAHQLRRASIADVQLEEVLGSIEIGSRCRFTLVDVVQQLDAQRKDEKHSAQQQPVRLHAPEIHLRPALLKLFAEQKRIDGIDMRPVQADQSGGHLVLGEYITIDYVRGRAKERSLDPPWSVIEGFTMNIVPELGHVRLWAAVVAGGGGLE